MIKAWRGEFGDSYTQRNQYDWRKRVPVFKKILGKLPIRTVLEVGANLGLNLNALDSLGYSTTGLEPNQHARKLSGRNLLAGEVKLLPFSDSSYDLVFTCGVLIHVPPEELEDGMKEILRVSAKYVLAIEYKAPAETMVVYRGKRNMLWKRPFGRMYRKLGLELIGEGKTPIDRCHYWLFEKG